MRPLSIADIRRAVAGKGLLPPADAPMVQCVCTDSRKMQRGALFIAIKGDNFDGHRFLADAAAGGAVAAMVQELPAGPPPRLHLILVPDTRKAMGRLARHVRQSFRAKVVAVAGSNGKTTTKNLIDAVLSVKLRGSASLKSFNNDIGVPITIFPADPMQDYVIVEIGTNHPGEVSNLAKIAMPDVAVLTNCGPEHLEFLGDVQGVRNENAGILDGLNEKGLLIVNGDDPALLDAVADTRAKRITFGFGEHNDLFAADVECDDQGVRFKLNGRLPVSVPLLGRHNAANALAAIAVARRFNLSEQEIAAGLARAQATEMRLEVDRRADGVIVLNDAYNANPASMQAALETLRDYPATARRVAILGDMKELGAVSNAVHDELGRLAAASNLDLLVCIGAQCDRTAAAARGAGMAEDRVHRFADANAAAQRIRDLIGSGDVILIKASRSMKLETVAGAIPA